MQPALGAAFLVDYLDNSLRDEDDLAKATRLPVLAVIPKLKDWKPTDVHVITREQPTSPPAEAYRSLRTAVQFLGIDRRMKIIQVTSPRQGEGKTTTSTNLAVTCARAGQRVVLVDCDLRRPSLHRIFSQNDVPGLSDLLVDADHTAQSVRHLTALNLDFIPDGTEPPNPTQLLNSDKMRVFLASAHERYDYVVLDVPPLLPVADALILASQVDLNVLVIESCRIPEKLALRALKSLHSHGAAPAGAVLNDKTGKGARYYGAYSYYEGKYYQGYYRRNEPAPPVPGWRKLLEKVWGFVNG